MFTPTNAARILAALLLLLIINDHRVYAQNNAAGSSSAATRYIFAFGDSYTATGFNATETVPAIGNPFGNPTYPGITSSGIGNPNWIDFLVHDQAPASTLCYNFAWLGATVTRKPTDPPFGTYFTFTDQIQEFENVKSTADWSATNALFISWFGINDIALNTVLGFPLENGASAANRYEPVVTPYFEQLDAIYKAGGRYFLIFTVPPIDRTPVAVRAGYSTVANTLTNVTAFNQVLQDQAQVFLDDHNDSRISIVDTSIPFNKVLNSPSQYGVSQYGATNVTCQNSDGHTCLWSNEAHPAVAIHQALSEAVYQQLHDLGFWNGSFNAGPVEASAPTPVKSSAASSTLNNGTIWLVILVVGIVIGRSTRSRSLSWWQDVKLGS